MSTTPKTKRYHLLMDGLRPGRDLTAEEALSMLTIAPPDRDSAEAAKAHPLDVFVWLDPYAQDVGDTTVYRWDVTVDNAMVRYAERLGDI